MTAFASATKNITVYPADHPRVVERATAFVAEHKALGCTDNELIVHQDALELDGVMITTDHLAVDWLRRRCRETGTGSIRLEANCRAHDVIAFASALIDYQPGSGVSLADSWTDDSACIRPIALRIEERRARQQASGTATTANRATSIDASSSLQEKLRAIAGMPSERELGQALHLRADTPARRLSMDEVRGRTRALVEVTGVIILGERPQDEAIDPRMPQ